MSPYHAMLPSVGLFVSVDDGRGATTLTLTSALRTSFIPVLIRAVRAVRAEAALHYNSDRASEAPHENHGIHAHLYCLDCTLEAHG
jgi:hypothetical protein